MNFRGSIPLGIGEVIVGNKGELVRTILGSCVAVCMYDDASKLAAICHAVYAGKGKTDMEDVRYVVDAVRYMHRCMARRKVIPERVKVRIFGGSMALGRADGGAAAGMFDNRNVEHAQEELVRYGYRPVVADVGGSDSRELYFDFATGDIYVRRIVHKKLGPFQVPKT